MTMRPPTFAIHESSVDGWVRLRLTGELDLGSAPALELRLGRLRALNRAVSLDLSELEFIDSTGLHILIGAFSEATTHDWKFQIEGEVSPQVMRLFKLVHLEDLVSNGEADELPQAHAWPGPAAS